MFRGKKGLKKLLLLQALIGGGSPAVERIALGNPLTFGTDLVRPLVSLEIPFTPQQEGTGDPSPQNIRSIIPWNGLTAFGGGKNLLNIDDRLKLAYHSNYSNWSGENGTVTITGNATGGYIMPCKANTQYVYSFNPTYRGVLLSIRVYEFSDYPQRLTDGTLISNWASNENRPPITFTTTDNAKWLVVGFYAHDLSENITLTGMQLEVGRTATAYEPYHPITETDIVFPALGKNLLPESDVEYGSYGITGGKIQDDNNKYRRLSIDLPAGNYVFSTDTPNCYFIRLLVNDSVVGTGGEVSSKAFTLTEASNVKIAWRNTDTSAITDTLHNQIEAGQSATAYEPYTNAVYGGTLDVVSGVLTVKSAKALIKDFEWSYNDTYGYMQTYNITDVVKKATSANTPVDGLVCDSYTNRSAAAAGSGAVNNTIAVGLYGELRIRDDNYSDASTFVTAMGESVIVYPLATPQEIQLTTAQLTALVGDNTIWSDADGSLTAVYLVSSKYADEHPVGGLGFGFGSGSSDPDEPDDPENPDEPEEPIIDDSENNQTEGEEP